MKRRSCICTNWHNFISFDVKAYLFLFLVSCPFILSAQENIDGVLINANTGKSIPFATVRLVDEGSFAASDDNGYFNIKPKQNVKYPIIEIWIIGNRTEILVPPNADTIFVDVAPVHLSETAIGGLSAVDLVKKVIDNIPVNYMDSSFAANSFYRQYQQINGKFKNLIESEVVALFQLEKESNTLSCDEAFAVKNLRKSEIQFFLTVQDGSELKHLMKQNPVYHLSNSSIYPSNLSQCSFQYDVSTNTSEVNIINYSCSKSSSESHGISNYSEAGLHGESIEYGRLWIDPTNFVLKKYERFTIRNRKYNYPHNNNYLLPEKKYTIEFGQAHLIVEYQPIQSKWHPTSILYSFTNDYFKVNTNEKTFTISENFEWYLNSVSRTIDKKTSAQFYNYPNLSQEMYPFHPDYWKSKLPNFAFDKNKPILEILLPDERQGD